MKGIKRTTKTIKAINTDGRKCIIYKDDENYSTGWSLKYEDNFDKTFFVSRSQMNSDYFEMLEQTDEKFIFKKEETKMVKETVYVKKEKRNQEILTTEELENKLDGLYSEFKTDICECILNCHQGTFRIDAILNDNYEVIDYDYDILENNSYRIHNDGNIRINVYYNEQNGFGYDELYDECVRMWCNDHNIQYYDDETGYFYEDYDRDEVSEIFKELYLDDTEFDDRFSENVKYHLND